MALTGLERVIREPSILKDAGRLGLLYNQASVDSNFNDAPSLLARVFPDRLKVLFGPQHGVWGTEQDNMKETDHGTHAQLGIPVYSLYSESRRPALEWLDRVDTVLADIQDVGTRVYTFGATVMYMMEACAEADKALVVLDRPNPVNGIDIEGNLLRPELASFVGPYPIPMRHGLTLGELMRLYNEVHSIGCRLKVVETVGWKRAQYFDETGLPWVIPSPNMPLVETAVVYPGQVLLEGVNLSEGRGTTRPFELWGAPYLDIGAFMDALEPDAVKGLVLRPIQFRPTFNKWAQEVCHGFQIHVTDRKQYRPYLATLAFLAAALKTSPGLFQWVDPPYEYVYDKPPIDVITGDVSIREDLESGRSVLDMEREWQDDLNMFERLRSRFFLYD